MNLWLRLYNRHWFWRFRSVWVKTAFNASRIVFVRKERAREFREHATISGQLLAVCRPSLFAAVVTVVLCELAWSFLLVVAQGTHAARTLSWLSSISRSLSDNGSTMDTLLSVIAAVCGVFLALYFTAVSVVAQAGFATAPNAVKDLLLKEQAGNLYMRILTLLTCMTLILLGTHALGYQPTPISILVTLILGILSIISFMALGLRAFYFFDPSRLANVVASDFLRNARMATSKGFRWHDRNFQAHYHKLAAKDLNRAQNLVTLCQPTPTASAEAAEVVLQTLTSMMGAYAKMKRRIPTDSQWYAQSPQHKNWFLQDHTAIDMAVRTHTSIQPTMVADRSWVESKYISMIAATWAAMLKANATEAVYESICAFGSYIEELGGELDVPQAMVYLRSAKRILDEHYGGKVVSELSENLMDLGVLDALAFCTIASAIGFFKHIQSKGPNKIEAQLTGMQWESRVDLYAGAFPASILPKIEYINRCITFELQVENRTVSPAWYLRQLAVIEYCDALQACFAAIIASFSELASMATEWSKRNAPVIAVLFGHRALELHFKITGNLPHIKEAVGTLRTCEICKEITAKSWDWDAFEKRIADIYVSLIIVLAKAMPGLSAEKEVSGRPDFFGQTYNNVCQSCYEAMRENRVDMFKEVFPPLFISALRGHDALRKMLKDREPQQAISWASEPLLDIMALSGYAQLYSDFYHTPTLWAVCQDVWLTFLSSAGDPHAMIQFLVTCQNLRQHGYQLYPRDILRTNWKIAFNQTLEEAGLLSSWDNFESPTEAVKRSATPLLRVYCRRGHHSSWDGIGVFIIVFLLRHPSAQGIDYRDVYEFGSALAHEEQNQEGRT